MATSAVVRATKSLDIPSIFNTEFENLIKRLMEQWEVPGLTLSIVPLDSAHAPLFKTFGTAFKDQPITSQTRFPICSLTKLFTSLTLLQLLDEHTLTTDTPIQTVLPDFRLQNETPAKRVTFAHALSHSSGIQSSDITYTDPLAQKDMIKYLSTIPCASDPGQKAFYSNYMYDILGLAIEALSGLSFEIIFKERIFKPLGMESTSFEGEAGVDVAMGLTPRLEAGTLVSGEGIEAGVGPEMGFQAIMRLKNGMAWGSSGIISTSEDMSKWIKSLASNPYFSIASIASDPTIEIEDGWYPLKSLLDSPLRYGMAGYRSNLSIIPELGIGIVALSNSEEAHELGAMIKIWAIRRSLGSPMDEMVTLMSEERDTRMKSETANQESIIGLDPSSFKLPLGKYQGPGLGIWNLTTSTYVSTRPKCINIPYLPWLYGRCIPILNPVEEGVFEGCMQWTKEGNGVYYGCPFRVQVDTEGGLEITGSDWGDKGEMCALRRVD